ncbi:MAG: ABC transporter substrate-binding protein [Phototrophicales bacterium]|nr:MAG: ABC transporter substrate-binding protein [Phototrophicales bacterium]
MKKLRALLVLGLVLSFVGGFVAQAQENQVTFLSTQFNTVDEAEKASAIVSAWEGGQATFTGTEEGPMIELLTAEAEAGSGTVDLIGALHGTFPTLAQQDLLFDLSPLLEEILLDYELPPAYIELGKMGSDNYQYYIPWMQATYIMAAHVDALQYLPEGSDINALTWEELAQWAKNMYDATGQRLLGLPVDGLMHRFLEGYLYPSFTGGMVTNFRSEEAVAMWEFFRDELWPYVNEQSITYAFMQEPLLAGEVLVAFDHTARLRDAFEQEPDNFVAFPAPAGPAGRGFMPVIAGLAIPFTAPNPDGAEELLRYMLTPEVQGQVLIELGFFPVVSGVDTNDMPEFVQLQSAAVEAQANSEDALPALLPVGLGDRGGEINEIYRNALTRIVFDGEDIQTVLDEEGAALQTLLDETGAACWPPDPPSEGPCQVK